MVKKKRTKVTREQKERITLASLEPKSDLNELASKYKLACLTLIKQRRQHTQTQEEARLHPDSSCVEVKVEQPKKVCTLKKVDLTFTNHRCSVEGNLNSSQLLKLVELLEGAC